ncbi:hypothetical protein BWR19_16775 [Halomonas sp. 1513]|nr:hypothetical protein [Halomonas sp. 1513]APX94456.1 hypothetical protein BWR19_16775 [Halomonas sp. 1513]
MPDRSHDTVPMFMRYAETRHLPPPDLLHCETIEEHSWLSNWHIKSHRHANLSHLLYIATVDIVLHDLNLALTTRSTYAASQRPVATPRALDARNQAPAHQHDYQRSRR